MAVIAPKLPRGPGLIATPAVPTAVLAPGTRYIATGLMDAADLADPTLSIPLAIQQSADGVIWGVLPDLTSSVWTGGVVGKLGPVAPHVGYSTASVQPAFIRVSANLPRVVNLGVDVATA